MGKQDSKSTLKLFPPLAAYDAAEQRIKAGNKAAEAHLQGEGQVWNSPRGGVVRVDYPHHDSSVAAQVVGQVNQGKENQRSAQHPPEPPLLVVGVGATWPAAQLSDTAQAEVANGEQREKETDDAADEGKWEALPGITQQYVQGTDGAVAPRASLNQSHTGNRYAQDQSGHPDRHTQQAGLPPAQQHQRAQRMHNGQVSVHTDAGDEEDAEVEVVVVEHPHSHA